MNKAEYIIHNYGFEDVYDLCDTILFGEKNDPENNLFYENAMSLLGELRENEDDDLEYFVLQGIIETVLKNKISKLIYG